MQHGGQLAIRVSSKVTCVLFEDTDGKSEADRESLRQARAQGTPILSPAFVLETVERGQRQPTANYAVVEEPKETDSSILKGLCFCVAGSLPRKELMDLLKLLLEYGATTTLNPAKATYVITQSEITHDDRFDVAFENGYVKDSCCCCFSVC